MSSDPDAMAAELSLRFRDRLRFFAARRLRDKNLAEDVAQETLRRALEALRAGRVENLAALPSFLFETARHRITMIEKSEVNTSADARLTAVRISGADACQIRSPVRSDRLPHQIMTMDASANGTAFSNPVCMFVRPYDLMICGCQS